MNVQLEWPYRALLPAFARAGMHVDCVVLAGRTKPALKGLRAHYGNLGWPRGTDYQVKPLRTRAQVSACLALIREEFTRNPQFGWFVTRPDFMKLQKDQFLESIRQRRPRDFVVVRGRRVVGQFGFNVSPVGVFNAPVGGMGFNFALEIQGRGFAKHAYARVLSSLAARGVPFFIGGTSQAPVLKLAKIMGRFPISVELYPGKPFFPAKHFLKYLDS